MGRHLRRLQSLKYTLAWLHAASPLALWRQESPGPGDFYYWVKVNQSDGDRAWTSPIWIESSSTFSTPIEVVNEDDANGQPVQWFQTVTVQGKYDGYGKNIIIKDCTLVR